LDPYLLAGFQCSRIFTGEKALPITLLTLFLTLFVSSLQAYVCGLRAVNENLQPCDFTLILVATASDPRDFALIHEERQALEQVLSAAASVHLL
jgi:hypothetical protein